MDSRKAVAPRTPHTIDYAPLTVRRSPRLTALPAAAVLLIAGFIGCGASGESGPTSAENRPSLASPSNSNQQAQSSRPVVPTNNRPTPRKETPPPAVDPPTPRPQPPRPPERTFEDLLNQPEKHTRMPIDEARAAAAGIRKIEGKHLTLYTDLPRDPEIESLPQAFDLAVPQWCAYFEIDPAKLADWRLSGFLMKDKEKFVGAGLLPDFLPDFHNGFAHGMEIWAYEQPSAYYRRHLLLHEGTHAFMQHWLGNIGPAWYAEGMAELMATHRWQAGKLELNYMPADKSETPQWGRIKIIRDGFAAGQAKSLPALMNYGPQAHLEVEPYGWCWGAAAMFDRQPAFRPAFRELRKHVADAPGVFNQNFARSLGDEWDHALEEWQLFVSEADYGYDFARAAVVRKPASPLTAASEVAVSADRGWQSSGLRVEVGAACRLTATGRYQIGDKPKIWWCEPNGVTIEYHRGRPLGELLCAVRNDDEPLAGLSPLVVPQPIGVGRDVTFDHAGTLYFRINESPAHLGDNQGSLTVQVSRK